MDGSNSSNPTEDQSSVLGRAMGFCSVCLETVRDASERSMAKLKCGHLFHLDCIGSAFNAKGSMQCPNCRCVEAGEWLYANGAHHHEDTLGSHLVADAYEIVAGLFGTVQTDVDRVAFDAFQQFPDIFEVVNQQPSSSTEHVVPVLQNPPSMTIPFPTCPYLVARRIASNELVGHYDTVGSFPPLQMRQPSENSMPSIMQHRSIWSSNGARNLEAYQNVENSDVAASTGGWSYSGSGNQAAFNHDGSPGSNFASSYGASYGSRLTYDDDHLSGQVGQPASYRRPNPQRPGAASYRPNANSHVQRVNQPPSIGSRHEHVSSSRRPREREWLNGVHPDFDSLPHYPARHGAREDPLITSIPTARWHRNVRWHVHGNTQQFPSVRDGQSSFRRSADGRNYHHNNAQHSIISEPTSRAMLRTTPEGSMAMSGPSMAWQTDAQQFASARVRESGSRQSTYYGDLNRHLQQHVSEPAQMRGMIFGRSSPRIGQAFERSPLFQVESPNSFERSSTRHLRASSSIEEPVQDGLMEPMSPHFGDPREPQT